LTHLQRHCAICQRAIRLTSDGLCQVCYRSYVGSDGQYPDWLEFLIDDVHREFMAEYRRYPTEFNVSDLSPTYVDSLGYSPRW
jgi:hypothetical protein